MVIIPMTAPETPLRVFISSTFRDLQDYREAAFKAIHSLGGYSDDMIYWSADERDGATHSVERVKQCDLLVLILAHRYGYIPEGEKLSVTEMEYRTARESDIPIMAFFVDENIPWLPQHVEWERAAELKAFKERVESEVTRKTFKSPDELAALVSQALALFRERQRGKAAQKQRFQMAGLRVVSSMQLNDEPDAVIQIGTAEDGLPLLLRVQRSRDLTYHLESLAALVTGPDGEPPTALIQNFGQSLAEYAHKTWAGQGLVEVSMRDGRTRTMYVSDLRLGELFLSALTRLLRLAQAAQVPGIDPERMHDTAVGIDLFQTGRASLQPLESVGGQNRFLGVTLDTGEIYSVGRSPQNGQWVEWRPFIFETVLDNLPDTLMRVDMERAAKLNTTPRQFLSNINEFAMRHVNPDGTLSGVVKFAVGRQEIGHLVLKLARELAQWHERGEVHGDLKPQNVLLSAQGPELIDQFNLQTGDIAQGWTPAWSAPEQALGAPVSPASDVYPLGRMLADLVGGRLVGEVRKFKTPLNNEGEEENLFYNPSVYIEPGTEALITAANRAAWLSFIASCLRFDPERRPPHAGAFADRLEELLRQHPLNGLVVMKMQHTMQVATLLDASQSIAHVIENQAGVPGGTAYAAPVSAYGRDETTDFK